MTSKTTITMKSIILFILLIACPDLYGQIVDKTVLNQIVSRAKETRSDALIIVKDGQNLVYDIKAGKEKPIYIASAGKSLVALGIMKLVDMKLIDSLEQPVCSFFPEWKQGTKKDITIRMLLNHTSGLQNYPNAGIELEPPPTQKVKNIIQLALAAEISTLPGTVSSYNNKAVALLAGVVEKASGLRMDKFFERYFFKPMKITEYDWIRDEDGNPTAHGAFIIKPADLAKFGTLILNNGTYNGQQILSKKSVEACWLQSFKSEPLWGLLWWRMPKSQTRVIDDEIVNEWKKAGIHDSVILKLRPIIKKVYNSREAFFNEWTKIMGDDWQQIFSNAQRISKRVFSNEILAYYASGNFGNYLVVVPKLNLIAVRCAAYRNDFDFQKDGFDDFPLMVSKLLQE
jgi:CubicO group peptidase (beta-lactamase class C family)